MGGFCTFVAEKSVQLLFSNNHSQFVSTVDDKYDGMAFPEERDERKASQPTHRPTSVS